jgi:hypothetical protein
LVTTVATSVTGFFFPVDHFSPGHAVGILSLIVLSVAIIARDRFHLDGAWRPFYAVSAVIAQYLNVFVLIIQLFLKVPVLKPLAPTQAEPPFLITQVVLLGLFTVFAVAGAIRFRSSEPRVL